MSSTEARTWLCRLRSPETKLLSGVHLRSAHHLTKARKMIPFSTYAWVSRVTRAKIRLRRSINPIRTCLSWCHAFMGRPEIQETTQETSRIVQYICSTREFQHAMPRSPFKVWPRSWNNAAQTHRRNKILTGSRTRQRWRRRDAKQ